MNDFVHYREQYPIFGERVYFSTQCLGPTPRDVAQDMQAYLEDRKLHNRVLDPWFARLENMRGSVERLLNAPAGSVGLRDSSTACQAAVISSIEARPRARRIVVSALDFHSALHLYAAQIRRGFELTVVPSVDGIRTREADLVASITEDTAVVAVSWVSRHSHLLDLEPVIARAHEVGALVVVDAYQAVGLVPIDVESMKVDVLVGGVHKWLSGETGLAFLYVQPEVCERLDPAYPGWIGHAALASAVTRKSYDDAFEPAPGAQRFQQGTPGMAAVYGSRAGLELVLEMGVSRIRARNSELTELVIEGLDRLGLEVVTPREPEQRAGGVCVRISDPQSVVDALCERGIDVDQRRNEVVRIAPHACNSTDECEHLLENLAAILRRR